jgi:hypothetical protein
VFFHLDEAHSIGALLTIVFCLQACCPKSLVQVKTYGVYLYLDEAHSNGALLKRNLFCFVCRSAA